MSKRRISFDLAIGSQWEPDHVFPQGGSGRSVIVDFETDGLNPFDDAVKALKNQLGAENFHIWYWWWLEREENL